MVRRRTVGGEGGLSLLLNIPSLPQVPKGIHTHVQMIPTLRYSHRHTNKSKFFKNFITLQPLLDKHIL